MVWSNSHKIGRDRIRKLENPKTSGENWYNNLLEWIEIMKFVSYSLKDATEKVLDN